MIENITLIGISDEFADEMIDKLGYDSVLNLACNHELVKKNIELLKSFGIKDIEALLLNREHIFLKASEGIVKKFSKYNIPALAELINNDYTVIDEFI